MAWMYTARLCFKKRTKGQEFCRPITCQTLSVISLFFPITLTQGYCYCWRHRKETLLLIKNKTQLVLNLLLVLIVEVTAIKKLKWHRWKVGSILHLDKLIEIYDTNYSPFASETQRHNNPIYYDVIFINAILNMGKMHHSNYKLIFRLSKLN